MRSADIATGILLFALGAGTVAASQQIAGVAGERLHPRTLPVLIGWVVALAGLTLAASAWRRLANGGVVPWPDREGGKRVAVTAAALVAYLAALEPIGLPLSTATFVAGMTWYLGQYRARTALLCGLATGTAVVVVFAILLGLSLPLGPLKYL